MLSLPLPALGALSPLTPRLPAERVQRKQCSRVGAKADSERSPNQPQDPAEPRGQGARLALHSLVSALEDPQWDSVAVCPLHTCPGITSVIKTPVFTEATSAVPSLSVWGSELGLDTPPPPPGLSPLGLQAAPACSPPP